ncbi:Carboxylesterase type B protein [Rutstroemia sp. NJR-2017a BBW]|nr:Carboxylesterase type B protein [Rutstroemia sp. NJR-2017a BBW]
MHIGNSAAVGLLATIAFPDYAAAKPYVVDSKNKVSYQGVTTSPWVETFSGIRYGLDTSGERRFAPPQAFKPKSGTHFNVTAPGPSCPQTSGGGFSFHTNVTYISEDCLNLNLGRPSFAKPGSKLPVMAYIYGGGLNTGTASERTTAPDGLIRQSVEAGEPVIYVVSTLPSSNSYLADLELVFGFATSEALRGNKSLNVGLRDQRLALEWIQENIELFGGDPDKVTIYGQSSGGLSVGMQVLAYGNSKPIPFSAAIMESTALEPTMASNISFNTTTAVANLAGCNNTDSQSPEVIACLRSLSMESLLDFTIQTIDSTSSNNDGDVFLPTVDQDFLPEKATKLLADGKFPKIPVMAGWQEDDATLFTSTAIETANDTKNFISLYYNNLTSTTLTDLLSLYPSSSFAANPSANLSSEFYRTAQIFRDILLTCPSFLFVSSMAKKYNTPSPPTYLFSGNQTILTPYLESVGAPGLGIIHTSELAYLFSDLDLFNVTDQDLPGYTFAPTESDYALAKSLPRSWISFGKSGKPSKGNGTLPGWTSAYPYGKGEGEVYIIGGGDNGMSGVTANGTNEALVKQRLGERCGFLNSPEVIEQLLY